MSDRALMRDDASLLDRLRTGSSAERERAFEELVRSMRRPLLSLCVNLTRDHGEAEDALQETFVTVHRSLGSFRGECRISTWVWRIAIRAAMRVRAHRPSPPDETPLAETAAP